MKHHHHKDHHHHDRRNAQFFGTGATEKPLKPSLKVMSTEDSLRTTYPSPSPSKRVVHNMPPMTGHNNNKKISLQQSETTLVTEATTLPDDSLSSNLWETGSSRSFNEDNIDDVEVEEEHPHVHFDKVQVREYGYTVSDNPSVRRGPALGIEWEHQASRELRLSIYEAEQSHEEGHQARRLPASVRYRILKESGVSPKEIEEAVKQSDIGRTQRLISERGGDEKGLDKVHRKIGKLGHAIKEKLHIKRHDSQDELWDSANEARQHN